MCGTCRRDTGDPGHGPGLQTCPLSAVASGPQSLLGRDSRHREGVAWLAEPWKYGFNIPSVIFLCGSWDKTVQST